jgi:hypothetical protein
MRKGEKHHSVSPVYSYLAHTGQFNREYKSLSDASRKENISISGIQKSNNNYKPIKGLIFSRFRIDKIDLIWYKKLQNEKQQYL